MRIGETLALTIDCIDLKNNTLTVYRTLTQDLNYNIILGEHTKTYKKESVLTMVKEPSPMNANVKR